MELSWSAWAKQIKRDSERGLFLIQSQQKEFIMGKLKEEFLQGLDDLQELTQKQLNLFEGYSEEEYLFLHQLPRPLQKEAKRIEEEKRIIKIKLAKLLGCDFHPEADMSDFLERV